MARAVSGMREERLKTVHYFLWGLVFFFIATICFAWVYFKVCAFRSFFPSFLFFLPSLAPFRPFLPAFLPS
jgi:hypothetical protein